MKKILIFLAVCVSMTAFAQKTEIPEAPYLPIDERTNLVTYQDVVKQEGTPKVLYDRAMNWVKKYYKNTAEVIKSADPEKCVINMRSSVRIYYKDKDGTMRFKNIVYYNFKLECRDNRYRYTITDFKEPQHVRLPQPDRRGDAQAHRFFGGGDAASGGIRR